MKTTTEKKYIAGRLKYLRGELRAERISYSELAELQSLAKHIQPGDVELLEAAGVPEFPAIAKPARDLSFDEQETRLAAISRDVANENAPEIY